MTASEVGQFLRALLGAWVLLLVIQYVLLPTLRDGRRK